MIDALYDRHVTKQPICAMIAKRHEVLRIVDLPPMLGPVRRMIGSLKLMLLGTKSNEYSDG
jgi:hypothetical protein